MDDSKKAQAYERLRPGTGIPEAQKEERYERMAFKDERRALRRTSRNRGIVVPALPPSMTKETT